MIATETLGRFMTRRFHEFDDWVRPESSPRRIQLVRRCDVELEMTPKWKGLELCKGVPHMWAL